MVIGILLMLFLVSVFIVSVIRYNKKLYLHLQEKQSMQLQFNETLLHSRIEMQEETFRSISQEIHDNIGQELSFVKLNLNSIIDDLNGPTREVVVESKDLISKSIQQLRDIARSINTDYLNTIGLPEAVSQQLQLMERTGAFKTQLTVKGDFVKLDSRKRLVLFRCIQELLNNVIRHSEADFVSIELNYEGEQLRVQISDNGKGFDTSSLQSEQHNGIGLSNVVNRISLINGKISISSQSGKGTNTFLEVYK